MFIPVYIFLDSNNAILNKIWIRSFRPWFHFTISLIETFAFCDLCSWDERIAIILPAMIFTQINIINADAVFFKTKNHNRYPQSRPSATVKLLW